MSDATPTMATADRQHSAARDWVLVGLITVAGAVIRLSTILNRGLWLDEAISVHQADRPFAEVIATMAKGVHPPLFHLLMHFWMTLFGTSEFAVRSYASVWGILAIPAAYWVGKVIYDRDVGVIAAALVAYSPYLVWYSQEARMYSMMFFFALVSTGLMAVAVRRNRPLDWVAYTVVTFLGMFTHYFFMFFLAGEVMYFLLFVGVSQHVAKRRAGTSKFRWKSPETILQDVPQAQHWLMSMIVLGTIFALWLQRSVFMPRATANALVQSAEGAGLGYGQAAPALAWRINDVGLVLVQMLSGFHSATTMYSLVAMWPLVVSAVLVLTDFMRPIGRRSMLPPVAAGGILVISLLGMWQGQVLASRYFIGVAAPFFLVIAAIVAGLPRHAKRLVLVVLVALSIGMWADQSFNKSNLMRYDTREVIGTIAQSWQPGDTVIFEPFYLQPVIDYYLPPRIPAFAFPQYADGGKVRNDKVLLGQDLDRVSGDSARVWVVLSFQDIPSIAGDAYNTMKWFERHQYTVTQDLKFNGVELYELAAPDWHRTIPTGVPTFTAEPPVSPIPGPTIMPLQGVTQ